MERSLLDKLPLELRNTVFGFAMFSEDGLPLLSPEPALTQTCRQIRIDTLQLYYTINTFFILMPNVKSKAGGPMGMLNGWTSDDELVPAAESLMQSIPEHRFRKLNNRELRADLEIVFVGTHWLPTIAEIPVVEWLEIRRPLAKAGFDLRRSMIRLWRPKRRNFFSVVVAPKWLGGDGDVDNLMATGEIVEMARRAVEMTWAVLVSKQESNKDV
ncbi:hypothetical protein LTR78_003557 [Recurvomyces mirabilis]|uniref:Uncharacterized protein n=2 Tax=Recurvomyces mirabilis TaxID=574656 RepID=A0AAE0WRN2_9PEZI|nr:hypothetical protein LTR78_003557 [Recurvomyces mirabilis]